MCRIDPAALLAWTPGRIVLHPDNDDKVRKALPAAREYAKRLDGRGSVQPYPDGYDPCRWLASPGEPETRPNPVTQPPPSEPHDASVPGPAEASAERSDAPAIPADPEPCDASVPSPVPPASNAIDTGGIKAADWYWDGPGPDSRTSPPR